MIVFGSIEKISQVFMTINFFG